MQKQNKKAKVGPKKTKKNKINAKIKTKKSKLCPNQSWVEI